ncbi:MAG TPA: cupin domain-containing protein [Candidatus Bathyarchaeia archaeon]|nr:cupin domain-containing protein [Candidatus Bathyarchaeia archaeon]
MIKTFDKAKAGPGCNGTILGTNIFTGEMEGFLDEVVWGFLKKGMKVYPHKHPQKELYIFVRGRGTMQVDGKKKPVGERDVVFIPPNSMHTAWNDEEEDLEFILVRAKNVGSWTRRLVKLLTTI